MWITHSYIGVTRGKMRYLFFLLYEDYIESQTQFAHQLDLELERFARRLRDKGAVVRPFIGDIEEVKTHILEKNWTRNQREELRNTPAILMINVDFNEFDPQKHPWFILHFGRHTNYENINQIRDILERISESAFDESVDLFNVARQAYYNIEAEDIMRMFELRPGIFGFSIDLRYGIELFRQILQRYREN